MVWRWPLRSSLSSNHFFFRFFRETRSFPFAILNKKVKCAGGGGLSLVFSVPKTENFSLKGKFEKARKTKTMIWLIPLGTRRGHFFPLYCLLEVLWWTWAWNEKRFMRTNWRKGLSSMSTKGLFGRWVIINLNLQRRHWDRLSPHMPIS